MNNNWSECKKILCIRADNMGDLVMSTPAIRALKESFTCQITLLTSSMAAPIVPFIPAIDELITFNLPWVKTAADYKANEFLAMIEYLRSKQFDAAVIFTVYSQNPLPSAMIAFMAGIPLRLAYCRENPYALLTDWVPEEEPYSFIRHQVQRDLDLVETIGASTNKQELTLHVDDNKWSTIQQKLIALGFNPDKRWVIFHPGVSEEKRMFPAKDWISLANKLTKPGDCQVLFTGGPGEAAMILEICDQVNGEIYNLAGQLNLEEFILLIKNSPLVVSVNTGTIHIAAATQTPVVVFYALTNPQHLPWQARGKVFPFEVPAHLQSRNEVIRFVHNIMEDILIKEIDLNEVLHTIREILSGVGDNPGYVIPDLIHPSINTEQVL